MQRPLINQPGNHYYSTRQTEIHKEKKLLNFDQNCSSDKYIYNWQTTGRGDDEIQMENSEWGVLRPSSLSVRKQPEMKARVAMGPETCKEGLLQV